MKKTIKPLLRFSTTLLLGLLLVFGIHALISKSLGVSVYEHLLIPSYWVNYLLVVFTFAILIALKNRKSQSLGFVFLGGFFVKIAVFLIFFKPIFSADGEIATVEFVSFFTPYAVCLAYETYILVTILNKE
ncbi:MAG: DUF6168 family protein [Vicingaceae bacterium]